MSNLRFDTDHGRETAATLNRCASNIEAELSTAISSATALVPGSWEAQAAHQFLDQFDAWSNQTRQTLEMLHSLHQRLLAEIEEWEATAAMMT
jgi:uncharacterized protein YukE